MTHRRLLLIPLTLLIGVMVFSAYVPPEEPIVVSRDLILHVLDKDVWRVEHRFPWTANALLLRLDDRDFVLVDTPQDVSGTEDLLRWMDRRFGRGYRLTVVNTHFHSDCLGGNSVLIRRGDTVMGSTQIASMLAERGEASRARSVDFLVSRNDPTLERFIEGHRSTPFVPPNLAVDLSEPITFTIANEPLELFFPGAGHSLDNIVVYFPRRALLFGGCLIKALGAQGLGNTADGDVAAWPGSVQRVIDRYPYARMVIPGHGPEGDRALLAHTLELLQSPQ